MMNQAEKAELLEQLEQWNKKDEYSRCIRAIEAIPEQERGYLLTVKLSRAYSNLAVLGNHGVHGTDGEVDGDLIRHAIDLLESVRPQGENDPYWNSRMGYSCLMAYRSAAPSVPIFTVKPEIFISLPTYWDIRTSTRRANITRPSLRIIAVLPRRKPSYAKSPSIPNRPNNTNSC